MLHHCTVINIKGESYRLKERKKIFGKPVLRSTNTKDEHAEVKKFFS
ncbi:MAG: hypothetical protein V3U54_04930 [Thermodesulfobacteriota bacterium]